MVETKQVAMESLNLDPTNVRVHSEQNISSIVESLRLFGQRKPIVVQGSKIIAGNGTFIAAQSLGWTEISVCEVPGDWDETMAMAYAIADNRTAELAEWDDVELQKQIKTLMDLDWNVQDLGFEDTSSITENISEDEVPELPVKAKTKFGDMYYLGDHRLLCGDSTDGSSVDRLMNGVKADMVFTDPPYGVDYEGIHNDSRDGLESLLKKTFANYKKCMKPGASIYVFHSDRNADIFHKVFREFFHFSSMIIWVKNSLTLSQTDYQSQHEPCIYGWKNDASHFWFSDRKQVSVWNAHKEQLAGHTTPKPIAIVSKALQNSSKKFEKVLDLFGGSGSTLIAAAQTGRTCYMMELDPKYCDVIIQRWETWTHQKAIMVNE